MYRRRPLVGRAAMRLAETVALRVGAADGFYNGLSALR